MSLLCRLGKHDWIARGGEVLRDGQGKILMQWYVCKRHCGAMSARAKFR